MAVLRSATRCHSPSVEHEVVIQEAPDVHCNLLGTLWLSFGLNKYQCMGY